MKVIELPVIKHCPPAEAKNCHWYSNDPLKCLSVMHRHDPSHTGGAYGLCVMIQLSGSWDAYIEEDRMRRNKKMSWGIEVHTTQCEPGVYTGNEMRFETEDEAVSYALDLACRWFLVDDWRAKQYDEPVNYRWNKEAHRAVPVA